MNKKLITTSLVYALGVVAYVALIAWLIFNGDRLFGKMQNFWGPLAFLLLFVLSAAIVGALIFVKPVMLYLNNKKTEAIKLLLYIIGWLFIATAGAIIILAV